MKCLIILLRYAGKTLFNPKSEKGDYNYNIPMGLAYISAFLKQSGHEVKFLNLNHCDGIAEELIKDRLSKERFDFVITGGISIFYPDVKNCVASVRRWSPSIRIILGGGLISSQPEIMFNLLQPDYGVIGEGELTIKELFESLENNGDINTVNGLIFRNTDGQIVFTKPRNSIDNLDLLPWPDYEGMGFDEYLNHMLPSDAHYYSIFDNPRVYPIIASRSCPFSCTFCFHPLGKKYRKRSIENVMDELEYAIKKYKINIILFYDELFANDRPRIYDFCKRITELRKTLPWEVKWICQVRVDVLDEELITTMKNAGCFCLSLGLESYNAKVLTSMKKLITPKQIDDAIRLCAQHNMAFTGNFIFGDTAETVETYHETLKYFIENNDIIRNQISLTLITRFQGSPLYKLALQKGIIKDEIAFIEDRVVKGNIHNNFTEKMTDEEFQKMQQDINDSMLFSRRYSMPLLDKKNNEFHEIHVKCPYCKSISIYGNYKISQQYFYPFYPDMFICRNCHSRILTISKKSKMFINIYKIIGYKNFKKLIRFVTNPNSPINYIKKPLLRFKLVNWK